jgi:hypothetical protein
MKEKILTITKLAVPSVIILSIAYEWSYFYGLGIPLSLTPLGTSDFLKGWIRWYPLAFGMLTGIFLIKILIPRLENWKSEEEIIQSSPNPEATRKARFLPWRLFQYLGLVALLMPILFGETYISLGALGLSFLWARFIIWLFKGSPWQDFNLDALLFGGLAILSSILIGFQAGSSVLNSVGGKFLTTYKSHGNSQPLEIIRSFEQWTLVSIGTKEFSWIQHESNAMIHFNSEREPFNGLLCSFIKTYPCRISGSR